MALTSNQFSEFQRCSNDPAYFVKNYVRIDGKAFPLHPYHLRVIDNFVNHQKNLQLQSRMMGLTTLGAALILWKALFHNDKTIAIASPIQRESVEVINIIKNILESLPEHLPTHLIELNKRSLAFDNGSRIIAGGMNSYFMRGMSISMLYCDNFSGAPSSVQEEFLRCIMPCIYGSSLFISSGLLTDDPFGKLWMDAHIRPSEFHCEKIIWSDHPDRDQAWATEWIEALGEERFTTEHECRLP